MAVFQVAAGVVCLFLWFVVGVWFFGCLGYFDKPIDCNKRREFDFSQAKVLIHACNKHWGIGPAVSAWLATALPMPKSTRYQQLNEFYLFLKGLLCTNYLTEMNNFFLTEKSGRL